MAILSPIDRARVSWREVGHRVVTALGWVLFAGGWLTAKALRGAATAVGATLYAAGWLASAVAWPAACWCGRAVRLGWSDGLKPIGGRRGPA